MNIMEDDLEYICHDTALGFKVILSPPGEALAASGFAFEVPILESSRIVVTPTITITSEKLRKYDPEKRGCYYNSERKLRYFKTYTQSNCQEECFSNLTARVCGCVKFSMPSNSVINAQFRLVTNSILFLRGHENENLWHNKDQMLFDCGRTVFNG